MVNFIDSTCSLHDSAFIIIIIFFFLQKSSSHKKYLL